MMSVRRLLPIVVVLATGLVGCSGSPVQMEGTVTVTQTTSTTTTTAIPQLTPGTISTSPAGKGLAAATLFSFALGTAPSGGVPPYTIAWDFGDGAVGAGTTAAHIYASPGTFTAKATVTDSKAVSAQTSASVAVGDVTGRWHVTYTGIAHGSQDILLVQNQTDVTATINDPVDKLGSGAGSVSNPRTLSVSVAFAGALPAPYALTFIGKVDESLATWIGTVTGFAGCPCGFTATR